MDRLALFVLLVCSFSKVSCETREAYWQQATEDLEKTLSMTTNLNTAKNVILFIGDGMGMTTITASRIYKGQLEHLGTNDVKANLMFDTFPHVGLSKTYNNDRQVVASASSATALMCGVKTNYGTVGIDPSILRKDCATQMKGEGDLPSILKSSKDEGKSVGLITTSRVTHATPSGAYAHSVDRNWESTKDLKDANVVGGCKDIAAQLMDNGDIDVILGGGRRNFYLNNQTDPQTGTISSQHRTDGRDLIQEWKNSKTAMGKSYKYVWNKADFDAVDASNTDYLLGLFSSSHMKYDIDRANSEPSLADMTKKAIEILRKNSKGFFLMVEAARIDHAHHENYAKRAMHDVVAMDTAIKTAMDLTTEHDTLIVVTADHSHSFSINGYPSRGNDILGVVDIVDDVDAPYDKLPYTTLIYGNGPANYSRENLTNIHTTDVNYQQSVAVGMPWETHGGEDVPIYARGPMSHMFHGVHEQHYVYHVMAYASCVGSNKNHCTNPVYPPCTQSASSVNVAVVVLLMSVLYSLM